MKSFFILIFGIVLAIIIIVGVMFAFKICPPIGPWPTPPWCIASLQTKNVVPNDKQESTSTVTTVNIKPKTAVVPAEDKNSITMNDVLVTPTDINKIDYPKFYNTPAIVKATIKDPYCAITKEEVVYPVSYLGSHEFPQIKNAPLPAEISRIIGIKDTWVPEPNLNKSCYSSGYTATKQAYEKTLERVKVLGANQISFTNYVHFSDFKNAQIDGPDKAAVSEGDLRFVADKASKQNLKFILYLNLAPGKQTVSDIPNSSWLSTLTKNWEPFVLNQAKIAEETGIYAIMINHFDYQPTIKGFEDTYQKEMTLLLQKMKTIYSGRVLLMIDPIWGADLSKLDLLLKQVDGFIYTPVTNILGNQNDKTVSVNNLKTLYLDNFAGLGRDFNKYNKPIYIRILIQSSKEFLEKGWSEDMFCIMRGSEQCYQNKLEVDFGAQAIAYEAMLEAIAQIHNKHFTVGGVDSYGYWFTDVILPSFSQPQIAQSIRNKPAESIIKAWFK